MNLKVEGSFKTKVTLFQDQRGLFGQIFTAEAPFFCQANVSHSKENVIRGMHVQIKKPQGKLVYVVSGSIMDVVHDLRANSDTYGVTDWAILFPGEAIYLPEGTAHGFECLSESCAIIYLCTTPYVKDYDAGFVYTDAKAPWHTKEPVISVKDRALPRLEELKRSCEWMRK